MLNLFDTEKVPGVPHVQVYRDDERANRFYVVTERVRLARDESGEPLATFILYARDVDRVGEGEDIARGYLSLSTQVVVTPDEEQLILAHLRAKLAAERTRRSWFLRLINLTGASGEPEISYPSQFVDGSVSFTLLTPDLVPVTAGSGKPSLINSNLASFSSSLTQDGAELLRQVLEGGDVPAIVAYDLTFLARIPAVTIRIHGDRREFLREIITHYSETHTRTTEVDIFGFITYTYREHFTKTITTMEQFRSSFQSITIDIDDRDFRDEPEAQDLTKKLEEMALAIFKDTVMPSMFAAMAAIPPEQRKGFDSVVQTLEGTVDITLRRSDVVEKQIHPNGQLRSLLTPEEITGVMRVLDLGQPTFQELAVNVQANVDFEHDPVFGLKVFCEYDQQDDRRNVRVRKAKEFLIRDADHVDRFRVLMAKGTDGAPKDSYRYWSKIIYRETGEEVRVPASGSIETTERELVISYRRLGFVKVTLSLGSMPETVRSVLVRVRCPGVAGPSGDRTFELTREAPSAVFFTYTGRTDQASEYAYSMVYVLTDGQRVDVAEQPGSSETLVVRDPFELGAGTTFVAQGDFAVIDRIVVDALYVDEANDLRVAHHAELAANGQSSPWMFGLRDPDKLDFEYNVAVLFRDGSRSMQGPLPGRLSSTTFVGSGAVAALEVKLVPNWDSAKYRMALVELEYVDPANGIERREAYQLRPDDEASFKVQLQDRTLRRYRHRIRLLGVPPEPDVDQGWQDGTDTFLLVPAT